MTEEQKNTLLKEILVSAEGGNPEKASLMLSLLAESIAYSKLKETPIVTSAKPPGGEQARGIRFSPEEVERMPAKYRRVFAYEDKVVPYRQKPNGVYEVRYHKGGLHIEVSSKDFDVLKIKFVEALKGFADTPPQGRRRTKKTVQFNECAQKWLEIKEKTTKPPTYKEYKRLVEKDISPAFEGKSLTEMTRETIQDFLFKYTEEGKSRTAHKLQLVIRCILDLAASDYNFDSPMDKVVLPKHTAKKGKALTVAEERELIDYCIAHKDNAASSALLVLLYTGMRRSELESIRVVDENWLECTTSKGRLGEEPITRQIPITPMLRRVMPYIDFDKARKTNLNTINTAFKRLFPNHHVHELRYTFITRAKECGINPELVMLWDGHSFDKDVKSSNIDRGYTDYSESYAITEANKFEYPA